MTPQQARTLATRAELAALALSRLARSLEHPEARGSVGAAILESDRREARDALERLRGAIPSAADSDGLYREVCEQMRGVRRSATAVECSRWAAAWLAFAAEVDP